MFGYFLRVRISSLRYLKGRSSSGFRNQPNLEDIRPEFAGDEEPLVVGIVGNAVQDCTGTTLIHGAEQAGKVDPAEHSSG